MISSAVVSAGSCSTSTRPEANFTATCWTPGRRPTRFSIFATHEGQLKPSARKRERVEEPVVEVMASLSLEDPTRWSPRPDPTVGTPRAPAHDGDQSAADHPGSGLRERAMVGP